MHSLAAVPIAPLPSERFDESGFREFETGGEEFLSAFREHVYTETNPSYCTLQPSTSKMYFRIAQKIVAFFESAIEGFVAYACLAFNLERPILFPPIKSYIDHLLAKAKEANVKVNENIYANISKGEQEALREAADKASQVANNSVHQACNAYQQLAVLLVDHLNSPKFYCLDYNQVRLPAESYLTKQKDLCKRLLEVNQKRMVGVKALREAKRRINNTLKICTSQMTQLIKQYLKCDFVYIMTDALIRKPEMLLNKEILDYQVAPILNSLALLQIGALRGEVFMQMNIDDWVKAERCGGKKVMLIHKHKTSEPTGFAMLPVQNPELEALFDIYEEKL